MEISAGDIYRERNQREAEDNYGQGVPVRAKITYAEASLGLESEWETAAKSIGVNTPSKETIRLVLEALKSLERSLGKVSK